jgi:tetratricopeptide (TPR) repeat protein
MGLCAASSYAESLPSVGAPAPSWALPSLQDNGTVRLEDLRGRVVFLLFGELYNENSIAACRDLASTLSTAGEDASAYLIITQKAPVSELRQQAQRKGVAIPILRDADRRVLADYRVLVLPSLVVIDPEGTVILSCAGYPLNFPDLIADAVLYAAGRLTDRELERRRVTATAAAVPENTARALRLAALGHQLARRGSPDLAADTYRQAIAADADCLTAQLGLGTCLLNGGELAAAETHFQRALAIAPDSADSAFGLLRIQIRRGGDELAAAAERMQELRQRIPHDSRIIYFTGLVAEKAGDTDTALRCYRLAAEQMLYGPQRERTTR